MSFFNFSRNKPIKVNKYKTLEIRDRVNFTVKASDTFGNIINKVLIIYNDGEQIIHTIYNIPSLILIDISSKSQEEPIIIFYYSDYSEEVTLQMSINGVEVNSKYYNVLFKIIPKESFNSFLDI
jgi:hypothetical protein